MQEKKQKTLLDRLAYSGLIGLNEDNNIHFMFNPYNFDIMRINWNSPNDGLENNLVFSMNPKTLTTIKIKDNH